MGLLPQRGKALISNDVDRSDDGGDQTMSIRILFADDEQGVRDTVSLHLQLEGFEVATANNGIEAIVRLEKEPFDLVLLDIDMPNLNGIGVLRYIRTHQIHVKPIMLTGADDPHAVQECAKLGAVDYLPRPYNFHELRDSIARVIGNVVSTERGEDSP